MKKIFLLFAVLFFMNNGICSEFYINEKTFKLYTRAEQKEIIKNEKNWVKYQELRHRGNELQHEDAMRVVKGRENTRGCPGAVLDYLNGISAGPDYPSSSDILWQDIISDNSPFIVVGEALIGKGGIPSDAELFDAFNYYNPWIILGEALFK